MFVLVAVLHWAVERSSPGRGRTLLAVAALGVLLYLSHLLAWVMGGLAVLTYALVLARRGRRWAAGQLVACMAPGVLLAAWYVIAKCGGTGVVPPARVGLRRRRPAVPRPVAAPDRVHRPAGVVAERSPGHGRPRVARQLGERPDQARRAVRRAGAAPGDRRVPLPCRPGAPDAPRCRTRRHRDRPASRRVRRREPAHRPPRRGHRGHRPRPGPRPAPRHPVTLRVRPIGRASHRRAGAEVVRRRPRARRRVGGVNVEETSVFGPAIRLR